MPQKKSYHRIGISKILDDLIRAESIQRQKSITFIIEEIIELHYTNGTLLHKKINLIAQELFRGKRRKLPPEFNDRDTIYDIPKVDAGEISASKYHRKRGEKYKKKEFKNEQPIPEHPQKVDLFAFKKNY
jgi:hypothetical protein